MSKTKLIISYFTPNKTLPPPPVFPQSHASFYKSSLPFHSSSALVQSITKSCKFSSQCQSHSYSLPLFTSDLTINKTCLAATIFKNHPSAPVLLPSLYSLPFFFCIFLKCIFNHISIQKFLVAPLPQQVSQNVRNYLALNI